MPRKPIDYSKTIIYKIVCNDLNVKDLYVGHTTHWVNRKNKHKSDCYNLKCKEYNFKVYKFIRANGGWENWCMVEVEKYPCNTVNEAIARERYCYEQLEGTLNSNHPGRSKKESQKYYYDQNKEKINNKDKQYYNQHKEKRKEQMRQYNARNKEKLREQMKQYYDQNKEKLREYQRQYRTNKKLNA